MQCLRAQRGRMMLSRLRLVATRRGLATERPEGDISDAFASLSGAGRAHLPEAYRDLKRALVRGREADLAGSWARLLGRLEAEKAVLAAEGPAVVPQLEAEALMDGGCGPELQAAIRKRGLVVVRGVIGEAEARAYKEEIEAYVRRNPQTRAFPAHDPQVFELYWSGPQLRARADARMLRVQRQLMTTFWHASRPDTAIALGQPLTYADRLRIRQPGDASFALGPHMDGGSVERWHPDGYGRGSVYDDIWAGRWEAYDAWDASGRVQAVTNLHQGLGACSVFRAWQGWLSMSTTGPGEGTLLVLPLIQLTTAYLLLRPFFRLRAGTSLEHRLQADSWELIPAEEMTSELQGASPGHGQELADDLHPHLELAKTMVHVPAIKPGDYVAWHCDAIHAVDRRHGGQTDSSVLYIPVCPLTEANAAYVARQREAFRRGGPGPDFPGGQGEAGHLGRPTEAEAAAWMGEAGRQAFGLQAIDVSHEDAASGQVTAAANAILGF